MTEDKQFNDFIDKTRDDIALKARLSAENPVKFMKKYMTKEQIAGWKEYRDDARKQAVHTKGYSIDNTQRMVWAIPQEVYSANKEHWEMIVSEKRYSEHSEFLIVNPNEYGKD